MTGKQILRVELWDLQRRFTINEDILSYNEKLRDKYISESMDVPNSIYKLDENSEEYQEILRDQQELYSIIRECNRAINQCRYKNEKLQIRINDLTIQLNKN